MTQREVLDQFMTFTADRSGEISSQNSWSPRAVLRQLKLSRASLLKEILDRGQRLEGKNIQYLDCVPLSLEDRSSCPAKIPTNCKWMRSKSPIPDHVKIITVTDVIGNERITRIAWGDFDEVFSSRHKKKRQKPYYLIKNNEEGNYLYIYNREFLEVVQVVAVFSDPEQAYSFEGCDFDPKNATLAKCSPLDVPFMVEDSLISEIITRAANIMIPLKNTSGADILIDTLPNEIGLDQSRQK